MNRVGIIGGTFDPIHNGHIYIAREAKKILNLDSVIFMVSGNPPHKVGKNILDSGIRLRMVNESIKDIKGFFSSDYEIKKQGYSYTYKTLEYLKEKYDNIYFITGADCLINIETWKCVDRILDLCTFVVFPRKGYSNDTVLKYKSEIEKKYNSKIEFLNIKEIDDSSTKIRQLIKEQKYTDIKNLVSKEVFDIILKENLYRS